MLARSALQYATERAGAQWFRLTPVTYVYQLVTMRLDMERHGLTRAVSHLASVDRALRQRLRAQRIAAGTSQDAETAVLLNARRRYVTLNECYQHLCGIAIRLHAVTYRILREIQQWDAFDHSRQPDPLLDELRTSGETLVELHQYLERYLEYEEELLQLPRNEAMTWMPWRVEQTPGCAGYIVQKTARTFNRPA